jgi:hypothetical protein
MGMGRSTNELGSNDRKRAFLDWCPSDTCSGSDGLEAILLALIPSCHTISQDSVASGVVWRIFHFDPGEAGDIASMRSGESSLRFPRYVLQLFEMTITCSG